MLNVLIYSILSFQLIQCLQIDLTDSDDICHSLTLIQNGVLDYYPDDRHLGDGNFVEPYYWWQAGQIFSGMIDNIVYCNNDTYETLVYDALMNQRGENYDYVPSNQSLTEGNDDQGFWGMTVMNAVEKNFTAPQEGPDWLALTQAVYNTMWARWDTDNCGGGLRWQIFTWNSGYDYKNTISSACLFHISARLARFTGNETYVDTATEVYTWLVDIRFIEESDTIRVYDGADITDNCSDINQLEWSYNIGIMLGGAAYLYNHTEDSFWHDRVTGLVQEAIDAFSRDGILYERACQDAENCNNDQRFFKGVLARNLGVASILVPDLYGAIRALLETSSEAAAQSCSGGTDGHTCGMNWEKEGWDGKYGLGEQASSYEMLLSLLVPSNKAPLTHEAEGVAAGDSEAGLGTTEDILHDYLDIGTKDKAGSAIITAVVILILIGGSIWVVI